MDGPPTIRTLAKQAGVSSATISLALRNHPRISLKERERIQAMAAQVGYKTNPLMGRLTAQLRMSRKAAYQSTLGIVFTAKERGDLELRTVREWSAGCEARAGQLGYRLDKFTFYRSDLPPERLSDILEARGIQGLVTMGPFRGGVIASELDVLWRNCATVVVGDRPMRPALSYVANNQFSTSVHAMEEVARLGYRRPALCIHPHIDDVVEKRFFAGFLAAQANLPRKDHLPAFQYGPELQDSFRRWVKRYRPDVILTLHHETKRWLEGMGMNVPEDIGLVHLDHSCDLPGWAGMQQNNEQIGLAAVDLVVGQLNRNELGIPPFQKCIIISGTWIPGGTVRNRVATPLASPTARS